MKSLTKHTVLEKKVRHSLYMAVAMAALAAILGVISIIMPSKLPETVMTIPAILALVTGYYAIGVKDADLTIYKSQNRQSTESLECHLNKAR